MLSSLCEIRGILWCYLERLCSWWWLSEITSFTTWLLTTWFRTDGYPTWLHSQQLLISNDGYPRLLPFTMMVILDYFLSQWWLSWKVTFFTLTVIPDDLMMVIQSAVVHNDGTMFDSCTPIPGKKNYCLQEHGTNDKHRASIILANLFTYVDYSVQSKWHFLHAIRLRIHSAHKDGIPKPGTVVVVFFYSLPNITFDTKIPGPRRLLQTGVVLGSRQRWLI